MTTILEPPTGTYTPATFVREHAARVTLEKRPAFGHYRSHYSAHILDAAGESRWIGTVSGFGDGSGFSASSSVADSLHRSTTTRTRREAVEYLVACAAGLRWHS